MAASARLDAPPPLRWDGERLHVLDQTRLPAEEVVLALAGAADTADAIRRLAVRGAPLIGVAAAYGLAMEVARTPTLGGARARRRRLAGARPTARNLGWAVERVRAAALRPRRRDGRRRRRAAAEAIHREDEAASAALARHGADAARDASLPDGPVTRDDPLQLAARWRRPGRGTGLGVIAELADRRPVRVLACEARPLLQGARLTVWELRRLGIEHELLVDARGGRADARAARPTRWSRASTAWPPTATSPTRSAPTALALAARAAGVPFVAAGPSSSIDLRLPTGDGIEIEERGADEVRARRRRAAHRRGHAVPQPGVRRHARRSWCGRS